MAFAEALGRLGATLAAVLRTRLELAAIELEEESMRLLGYLLLSLLALFFVGVACVLLAFFVILMFWDSYRLQATLAMGALFAAIGVYLGAKVRASMASKPRLLAATIDELNKDIDFVKRSSQAHE